MELFRELHRAGMTVIIVTHEPQVAEYAQRVIRFRDGRIVADEWNQGNPHENDPRPDDPARDAAGLG
jgi:putative ABC transport system ATP-binding protein